jgi:hypothetical protein
MKRVALLVMLGIVAVHAARHAHRPPAPHHPPAIRPALHLASFAPDEPPAPPRPPAPKAGGRRPAPKAEAPAPAAEPRRQPDWFPRDRDEEEALAKPDARGVRVLVGPLAADEAKARRALRHAIDADLAQWLAGDVAAGWEPPASAIDRITLDTYVQPVAESLDDVSKDLDETYILYRAGARLDFSPARRSEVVGLYERELGRQHLIKGGALFAFVLFVLAVLAGYIRADESTKGYYTNRLRMLAAAGVGAAGVVVYRMLA